MEEVMNLPDTDRLLISMRLRVMGIDALGRPFEEASKTLDINNFRTSFISCQQLDDDTLLHIEVYPPQGVAGTICKFVTRGRVVQTVEFSDQPIVIVRFTEPLRFFSIHTAM